MLHHKLIVGGISAALALLLWFAWPPTAPPPSQPATEQQASATPMRASTEEPLAAAQPATGEPVSQRSAASPASPVDPLPEPPSATNLLIKLLDAEQRTPLAGYGVAIRRRADLQNFGRVPTFYMTDERGEVLFLDLEAEQNWLVDVDRVGVIKIVQAEAGRTTEHTLALPTTGLIVGKVLDENGQPAAGASVLGHGSRLTAPTLAITDAGGCFEIRHVNQLELQARKAGHAPSLSHPTQTTPGARVELTLQLGPAGRRLSGVAHDHTGELLIATAVAILPKADEAAQQWDRSKPQTRAIWLRTDNDGRFQTSEVSAGHYLVVACPPEQSIPPARADADTTLSDAFVDLRSDTPTVIEGRITERGAPLVNSRILIFPEQPAADFGYLVNLVGSRWASIAADGCFRIEGVIPGKISMRAMRSFQVIAETRRELAAGQSMRWDVEIGENSPLRIKVQAPSALPRRLTALVYTKVDGAAPVMVAIDAQGEGLLDIQRSGPIDVLLTVMAGGMNIVQIARHRNVPANQRELHFELRTEQLPTSRMHGRLVDKVGAPLPGVTVRARRLDADGLIAICEAVTANDGTFTTIAFPVGEYAISIGPLRQPRHLHTATVTGAGDEQLGDVVAN